MRTVGHNYLAKQFNPVETDRILAKIKDLVATGDFTMGAPMREFEERFSKEFVGGRTVIGVNSGTDALILALKSQGIGPGDEVITQPNSFYATTGAIVAVGAKPVFVDVDETYSMNPALLKAAMSANTKAILPVWWGGMPPDWDAMFHAVRGVPYIEDACQGIGGAYNGHPAGYFGDTAAVSFHPIKTFHCWGDGGATITDSPQWLRAYRNHGMKNRDEILMWGVNARLQTIQAVVLLHIMDTIKPANKRRAEIAARLDAGLTGVPGVTIPPRDPKRQSAWRLYIALCVDRERLMLWLRTHGVETLIHYPVPLHLQAPGRALGYARGDFPVAERQADMILSLPCHEWMTDDDADYVVEQVRGFYGA